MSTEIQQQPTSLISVNDVKELIATAPAALEANTASLIKAKEAGQALLRRKETEGMTPELDAEFNNDLVRVRTTVENMANRRKPLTKFFDDIRKEFTRQEGELDRDNKNSIPAAIQKARDEFAAEVARRAKEEEEPGFPWCKTDQARLRILSESQSGRTVQQAFS